MTYCFDIDVVQAKCDAKVYVNVCFHPFDLFIFSVTKCYPDVTKYEIFLATLLYCAAVE